MLAGGAIPADWLTPSGERGAAAIGGILHNKKRVLESGIVPNRGAIPNLPDIAAVEVPVMADAAGIHPISLGPLPDPIAKLLHTQVNVQELAVEAAVRASKEIALQALLIDPVVNSAIGGGEAARRIVGSEPAVYPAVCVMLRACKRSNPIRHPEVPRHAPAFEGRRPTCPSSFEARFARTSG